MSESIRLWMVRAGRGAAYIDDFIEDSFVSIGWDLQGEIGGLPKAEIETRLRAVHPHQSPGAIAVWAAQILRFYGEIKQGQSVTTYDPGRRLYYLGQIKSAVEMTSHPLPRSRRVEWQRKVHRDSLSVTARNSLGSISALFLVPAEVAGEMLRLSVPLAQEEVTPPAPERPAEPVDEKAQLDEVVLKAAAFIEDRISLLDWIEMQELVAGLLEAMGYRTTVSERGPDRGVDIFASPDGLGLQEPRIFVEVKHRPGTAIGAPDLRSFLGGRRVGDRCLYVSTGGFTREALYEAERSSIPITLLNLPALRKLLVEQYPRIDPTVAKLVPLERIYWPSG